MKMTRCRQFRASLAAVSTLALLFTTPTPMAAPGGTISNGTSTQPDYIRADSTAAAGLPTNFFPITAPGFLFEPETPFDSLKSVPTWNEIEQILDHPYAVAPDSGTPGNFDSYPSYRTTAQIVRRPSFSGTNPTLDNPGPALRGLLTHPLNYNPTHGEEMRLLNSRYAGGPFSIPDELFLDLARDPTGNTWNWTFHTVQVSPGSPRVTKAEIDYNGPMKADPFTCVTNLEVVPPEGVQLCGFDPGEPGYAGFGVLNPIGGPNPALRRSAQYSTPAVPGVASTITAITTQTLFDPTGCGARNAESPGSCTAAGTIVRLSKPTLRNTLTAQPNYLVNTDPDNVKPSNENDYVRNRKVAAVLGKALFWDMQVGSDGVQSCGTCHFTGAGTDTRTKNQMNPNHVGGDLNIDLHGMNLANQELTTADFPFHKLTNPDQAGDPACTTPIVANVSNVTPALVHPVSGDVTVCAASNIVSDINDVASSMGVHFGVFKDIAPIGTLIGGPVAVVAPDLRETATDCAASANPAQCLINISDPIPAFAGLTGTGELGVLNEFRRVEPRNTPTMQAAGFNFDNFWDGRARHDFNGGSVFGVADPQTHVFVDNAGTLTPTRQVIKFSSIASLATGPGLSEFEMSFLGRNWSKIGKKLLQAGTTPLANQLVATDDSVLGKYSNQGGSACAGLAAADRSPGSPALGKPGLCINYPGLIRQAFYPTLWQNVGQHLNGCYTDGRTEIHPNQCAGLPAITILDHPAPGVDTLDTTNTADPFDGYRLTPTAGAAVATDTNQFRQMEGNFSLFWGLAVNQWVQILVPDNTPFDQFLEQNPDAYMSLGDTTETLLVNDLLNCTGAFPQRNAPAHIIINNDTDPGLQMGACFREVGNFKRDPGLSARINATAEGGGGATLVPAGGTRSANAPDPLLGMDIFFASNLSLKNPEFRSGRCGACHNMPTLTDNTMPFTFKAQLPDFPSEFSPLQPGVEMLTEPLGRLRVISGFLLESEIAENGQDGIERRFINQSIAPNPLNGIAYPDGVFNHNPGDPTLDYTGAGQAFIDNGVYNLGVRPIGNDIGRGGNDAFGWPLSLATLMMKNLGGPDYIPNVPANPITGAPASGSGPMGTFDPALGVEGGLFEESAQDQQINPGGTDEPVNPLLPPYLAPFANQINVGDAQPELDEPFGGINTLTDVAMLEGFVDVIGPISPSAVKNEALNMSRTQIMGTNPVVNRVLRDGAFKAPQLRDVELTAPYFHTGSTLTLRQVVDFYVRGGDFPITNARHRDFLLTNLDIEAQSNLSEEEKVALVDFLLELTDERVSHQRGPFDHPEVIVPVDGLAPDNTGGHAALLGNAMFMDVPAVGTGGDATAQLGFLNLTKVRVSGAAANRGSPECDFDGTAGTNRVSQYCR